MKRRKGIENTLFSFLDVISCGFGAIVMLVLIYKFNPSNKVENFVDENDAYLSKLDELQSINNNLKKINKQLTNNLLEVNQDFFETKSSIKNKQVVLDSIYTKNKDLEDSVEALKLVEENLSSYSLKKKKKLLEILKSEVFQLIVNM